ncbi:MAG TPA: ABC transporter permease [Thermoanaerobaculia bacterium]|nr:ABC transporter permease [Thermoanaerobaculia bacterium]
MDLLWKDIRHGIHSLIVHPGFAVIAILTLALGIGATTAIFSVVNGVLLQPLPLNDPARLVMIWEQHLDEPDAEPNRVSPANYTEWTRQTTRLFSSLGAAFDWELSMTGQGEPEVIRAGHASGTLFRTLGAKPVLGRVIERDDDPITVLSYAFWQRKFGGDPRVLGRTVQIDGVAHTIAGVMPREFLVPKSRADLWIPYSVPAQVRGRYLTAIARLAPGVTIAQAQAGMAVVARRTEAAAPQSNARMGVKVIAVHEQVVGSVRRALLIVFAAVAFLLLIACVNIANLLLSRSTSRTKEMAVRAALGASRGQLIRQLLTESIILATIAGILGIFIAVGATTLLLRFIPESAMMPRTAEIAIDGRVLAVTALLTLATGIIFGLAPALEASRTNLQSGLASATRGSSQDRRGKRFRNGLIVIEVALATVLLIGAGLLIKSFAKLERVDPGLHTDGVVTMRVVLPNAYATPEKRRAMVTHMLDEVRSVPGVAHAGAIVSANMPFTDSRSNTGFFIEGMPAPAPGHEPEADIRMIAGDYFRAMGMQMLAGRAPEEHALAPEQAQFVVNDAFARRYLGGNALGKRIGLEWFDLLKGEIVGVVSSVRQKGLSEDPAPAIYVNSVHDRGLSFTLAVAAKGEPAAVAAPVTRVLRSLDRGMPVTNVRTLESLVEGTISRPRFNATMLTLFAALGLLLASIGIYGVLSYSVSQRTQEMGIRMALGADASGVRGLVVRDGVQVAAIGIALGLVVAFPATRVLSALLYGVEATDATVFSAVALVLLCVALAASYLPAHRATRVDPMMALRPE